MDACRARRRWPALVLVAGLMSVVATACGPSAGGGGVPPRSGALVAYHVSGGFAGVDERLVVSHDGAVVRTSGRTPAEHGRLTAEELAALVDVLEASDFASLPPDTVDPRVADAFVYEVTYGGRRVRTSDGAIPPRLAPVLDRLREIAAT
jgi:hypothetical protein